MNMMKKIWTATEVRISRVAHFEQNKVCPIRADDFILCVTPGGWIFENFLTNQKVTPRYDKWNGIITVASIDQVQGTDNSLFRKCMLKAKEIIIGDYWPFIKEKKEESLIDQRWTRTGLSTHWINYRVCNWQRFLQSLCHPRWTSNVEWETLFETGRCRDPILYQFCRKRYLLPWSLVISSPLLSLTATLDFQNSNQSLSFMDFKYFFRRILIPQDLSWLSSWKRRNMHLFLLRGVSWSSEFFHLTLVHHLDTIFILEDPFTSFMREARHMIKFTVWIFRTNTSGKSIFPIHHSSSMSLASTIPYHREGNVMWSKASRIWIFEGGLIWKTLRSR